MQHALLVPPDTLELPPEALQRLLRARFALQDMRARVLLVRADAQHAQLAFTSH